MARKTCDGRGRLCAVRTEDRDKRDRRRSGRARPNRVRLRECAEIGINRKVHTFAGMGMFQPVNSLVQLI